MKNRGLGRIGQGRLAPPELEAILYDASRIARRRTRTEPAFRTPTALAIWRDEEMAAWLAVIDLCSEMSAPVVIDGAYYCNEHNDREAIVHLVYALTGFDVRTLLGVNCRLESEHQS